MSKVVLITGCSTGIGRDLAQRLTESSYTVVATARKVEALNDIPAALKLPLDVTCPESVCCAVDEVIQRFGRIDALVNNAGYGLRGVVEEISDEQARQVYDVNVFGMIRMVRAVAPHMRKQKSGRIINVSSIAGRVSTPVNGLYSSTKFALEALSDALRVELAPFGVQVVVVEPGAIKTNFLDTVAAHSRQDIFSDTASPYQPLYQKYNQFNADMSKDAPGPEVVSRVIQQALETPSPKPRYLAGMNFSGRLALYLRDYLWDYVLKSMFMVK
jgi:NAD(P)-dependent dehydrogenase (short-subunit alcohol dehydrogenase family)